MGCGEMHPLVDGVVRSMIGEEVGTEALPRMDLAWSMAMVTSLLLMRRLEQVGVHGTKKVEICPTDIALMTGMVNGRENDIGKKRRRAIKIIEIGIETERRMKIGIGTGR
jgi:hypothetical protein